MTCYINNYNIRNTLDFTFSNNLLILFLLSAKNSWFPEYPPFPAVHGLHGHIKPLFFSFFPFSSPLTFMFQWELLYRFVHSLHFSWSDPSSFSFFSLTTGFPTAKTNKLFYTQILPNPDFPKANTITQSGGKCSFSGKRLCLFLPPLSLPSIGPAGPPKPRERCVHFSAAVPPCTERTHTYPAVLNSLPPLNLHYTLLKEKILECVFHKWNPSQTELLVFSF